MGSMFWAKILASTGNHKTSNLIKQTDFGIKMELLFHGSSNAIFL